LPSRLPPHLSCGSGQINGSAGWLSGSFGGVYNMQTPHSCAAAIGRYWFRRIVRNPIPDSVPEVSAQIFHIPLIRSKHDLLVRFNFNPPFERDVQFWGWKEWKKGLFVERTIICGFAQMADVSIGRLSHSNQ
jgi:hypothetical protein